MSFRRKRGKKHYLYWKEKVRVPDPARPGELIEKWRQRSEAVSEHLQTFNSHKVQSDYRRERKSKGLTNYRREWKDFKPEFLAEYKGSTLENYNYTFGRFEKICQPGRLSVLTYSDAKTWRAAMENWTYNKSRSRKADAKPQPVRLSPTTINIDIRNMRTAWAEAMRLGYVHENIFKDVREISITRRLPRYLKIEEVRALKAEARASLSPDAYLIVLLFLHAGIRLQELINLRWESFDLERHIMYLHGSETWDPKDREENAIGLHDDLVAELGRRPRASDYVFPGRTNGPHNRHGARRHERTTIGLLNRLYKRAGIKATGCHILRHTFATHSGLSQKALQKVLGHSDPRTTMIYAHVTREDLLAIKNVSY